MRESVGGVWTFQLILVFILLFVGYIVLTLNYSRTAKVKNEVVSLVEKYNGLNGYSLSNVNSFLVSNGYDATGTCEAKGGVYGATSLDTSINTASLEEAQEGIKYYYCVKKYSGLGQTNYYQVSLFYKFNLPIVGNTGHFVVMGSTGSFQSGDESDYSRAIGS